MLKSKAESAVPCTTTITYNRAPSIYNRAAPPAPFTEELPAFITRMSTFIRCSKKSAPIWVPAILSRPSRESDAVEAMTAFVVDCDAYNEEQLMQRINELSEAGHHFLVHSSARYAPPEKAKVRFVFFLSKPIPVGTPWRWRDALWPRLMQRLGFSVEDPQAPRKPGRPKKYTSDSQCCNADRAYYLPIKVGPRASTFFHYHAGTDLDVDALVGDILAEPIEKYNFHRPYVSREDPSVEVNSRHIASRLLLRFTKGDVKNAIHLVLSGEPTADGVGRHEVIKIFTWALAHVADPEESSDGVLQVMMPWLEAMDDKYGQRGNESWYDEALRTLQQARAKKPTWDAYYAAKQARGAKLIMSFDSMFSAEVDGGVS